VSHAGNLDTRVNGRLATDNVRLTTDNIRLAMDSGFPREALTSRTRKAERKCRAAAVGQLTDMTDLETLNLQPEEETAPPIHPASPRSSAPPAQVLGPLALLSDTGAAHPYISKAGWLELLRHIATINSDGVLTAPVDFMAVQWALYSGLAMTT
jgi:hypothetical protein